jgi:hypothetical protein
MTFFACAAKESTEKEKTIVITTKLPTHSFLAICMISPLDKGLLSMAGSIGGAVIACQGILHRKAGACEGIGKGRLSSKRNS